MANYETTVKSALLVECAFALEMKLFGRENDIEYEIVEFDPPRRVVLRGENSGSVSVDTITVESAGAGSEITYRADVTMKGGFKLIGPLFGPIFKKMGDEARDAMIEWLAQMAQTETVAEV